MPVARDRQSTVDVAHRIEPAHKEAYVRIKKSLVIYPQILTAYDAVGQWLTSRGLQASGPPPEVYFTDFMAAGPDDEVVDVAIPM